MAGTTGLLAVQSLKKWLGAPGFLMVLAVALVPPALTFAWVGTHQADIDLVEFRYEAVALGDEMPITIVLKNVHDSDVGAFNVTLLLWFESVNFRNEVTITEVHNETLSVSSLDAGETFELDTTWNTTVLNRYNRAGSIAWAVVVDLENRIREIEGQNNFDQGTVLVNPPPFNPFRPTGTTEGNDTLPQTDLAVEDIRRSPQTPFENDTVTFTVTLRNNGPSDVTNATVRFDAGEFNAQTFTMRTRDVRETRNVNLSSGASTDLTFEVPEIKGGIKGVEVAIDGGTSVNDTAPANNTLVSPFLVDQRPEPREFEEKATAKRFYRDQILLPLHFTLLVPLIGLFYAGGVVADDRGRGNLVYLLSRPVPRWQLPLVRFGGSFIVALVAVLIGVLVSYLLLLGTPQAEPEYLYWPLFFGVVVLFLYASVATLLGVMFERPYLVGLLYLLGFETLVLAGRNVLVNDRPLVQDWVLNLSLYHWVQKALAGWNPDGGFTWLPEGSDAQQAFWVILGIGAASLALAAYLMQRREFAD